MFELIRANQRRSAILVVAMAVLLLAAGYALGELIQPRAGPVGLMAGLVLWIALSAVSYFGGDAIFLSLAGARRIEKTVHPVLFNVVEEMCVASGISRVPAIYIIDQAAPNAFATGRSPDSASVAVTAGLLERLDRDELQGVIAHELGHVKNRDILYLMMLGVMAGSIVILADIGWRVLRFGGGRRRTSSKGGGQAQAIILLIAVVLMILAPFVAQLIYFAVSRRREYLADAFSAQSTRYPEGLARALEKISSPPAARRPAATPGEPMANVLLPEDGDRESSKSFSRAMAPMFTVDPLSAGGSGLYGTHPPVEERIRILRGMGAEASLARYDESFRQVTRRPVGVVPFAAIEGEGSRPAVRPPQPDAATRLDRVRATTDLLWQLNQFMFVACACGTKLKIPPDYAAVAIACPQCGRSYRGGKLEESPPEGAPLTT